MHTFSVHAPCLRTRTCQWATFTTARLGRREQVALLDVASQREGPRWNLLQWLQYWCTRHAESDGAGAAAAAPPARTHSASSLDDEADSRRDAKRRWGAGNAPSCMHFYRISLLHAALQDRRCCARYPSNSERLCITGAAIT